MRASQAEKEKTHHRIVEAAMRLLQERGIEAASVADIMAGAGLTNGGFYKHFESKDALVAEALEAAFEGVSSAIVRLAESHDPGVALAQHRLHYLSSGHVANRAIGCPIAALAGDVARATGTVRKTFSVGVASVIAALARTMRGSSSERQERAMRQLAMLVGAVMIARASEPETADAILAACRAKQPERTR